LPERKKIKNFFSSLSKKNFVGLCKRGGFFLLLYSPCQFSKRKNLGLLKTTKKGVPRLVSYERSSLRLKFSFAKYEAGMFKPQKLTKPIQKGLGLRSKIPTIYVGG